MDFSANFARGLDLVLSTGHVRETQADGTPRNGRSANTWSGLARYEVQTGPLKPASSLWQYTWWGASRLNNRTYWTTPPGDLHTETAVGVTDHRNYRFSMDWTW